MNLSIISREKLSTCNADLQKVFTAAAEVLPMVIVCGYRGKEAQEAAVASGHSQTKFPDSKHNLTPSLAVDFAPYDSYVNGRIDWGDVKRFYYFAGIIQGIAISMGIKLRYGGDWDGDMELKDNRFNDIGHFETTPSKMLDANPSNVPC